MQGFEAEASARPARWLELGGSVSYTDGNYTRFVYTPLTPTVACNGAVPAGGQADISCLPFQYVVPWIYTLRATADLPVPARLGKASLSATYSHQSRQYTDALQLPQYEPGAYIAAYGILNLALDWDRIGGSGFDLGLFVTNATNKLYRISNTNVYEQGSLLVQATLYGEPRMYGLKLRYRFGQ